MYIIFGPQTPPISLEINCDPIGKFRKKESRRINSFMAEMAITIDVAVG
jgi:hypothetical protein